MVNNPGCWKHGRAGLEFENFDLCKRQMKNDHSSSKAKMYTQSHSQLSSISHGFLESFSIAILLELEEF
jgi:hypothetical protein